MSTYHAYVHLDREGPDEDAPYLVYVGCQARDDDGEEIEGVWALKVNTNHPYSGLALFVYGAPDGWDGYFKRRGMPDAACEVVHAETERVRRWLKREGLDKLPEPESDAS